MIIFIYHYHIQHLVQLYLNIILMLFYSKLFIIYYLFYSINMNNNFISINYFEYIYIIVIHIDVQILTSINLINT